MSFENKNYFIVPEDKLIISKDIKMSGNFFYDLDKIQIVNSYVFKGHFSDILREFGFEGTFEI